MPIKMVKLFRPKQDKRKMGTSSRCNSLEISFKQRQKMVKNSLGIRW